MKRLTTIILIFLLVMSMSACSTQSASSESQSSQQSSSTGFKIGVTVPDLSNPIWAEVTKSMQDTAVKAGATATVLECKNDSATQVSQIENFISQGVNAIIVSAADAASVDDVVKKAMSKGIVVAAYGINLKNYTISYTNDNAAAGELIGEMAAKFINDNYNGEAEVGLMTYYENEECVKRGKAMVAKLNELAPKAKVVMEASSVTADTGMTYTENFLQAHPNMKVIMSIGDGAAIGANQAVKAAGKDKGFGIFAIDGTIEALQLMANGDPIKGEVSFGAGWQLGEQAMNTCLSALTSKDFKKDNFSPNIVVTSDNLRDKISEWKYDSKIDLSKLK